MGKIGKLKPGESIQTLVSKIHYGIIHETIIQNISDVDIEEEPTTPTEKPVPIPDYCDSKLRFPMVVFEKITIINIKQRCCRKIYICIKISIFSYYFCNHLQTPSFKDLQSANR
ncbi:MAG: hypothetical protein CVU39_08390 [Chloroflexi bacterium HGW-Chloroflexi-10]|nr:MAG: hypothetical protein CVU39_08390 [Chloroflexi bacterium HGW-Chloroflexi-10]